ncbi:MAG TPA: HEPN domain-containing protein [Kofleriaceae bacterium]|nr:HEPN domain-containing protein [Kofleriaceae bacterium]
MEFDEKARENLEAAERLLPDETGQRDGLSNAAASRAYYAAYLAVVHAAQRAHRPFTHDEKDYYRHDRLPTDARVWRLVDADGSEDLAWLYGLRIKADYEEDHVDHDEASEALDVATRLVHTILGEAA